FISELIFVLAEDKLFGSNQQTIDAKYEKYSKKKVDWVSDIEPKFDLATTALQDLELDYENNRIGGVSHLFGLWSFIVDRVEQGKTKKLKSKIEKFYALLREDPHSNTFVSE
ncbi:hypothetical protein, partial [Pseudomonas viridiflava]